VSRHHHHEESCGWRYGTHLDIFGESQSSFRAVRRRRRSAREREGTERRRGEARRRDEACVLDGSKALQLELLYLLLVLSAIAIGADQDDRHFGVEAVDLPSRGIREEASSS
jgi:hypothetical protein